VIIALAHGCEVGVDLEQIDRLAEWSLLAERIFSSRELTELRAVPTSKRRVAFFKGWTRKEAYLKATGEGLTDDVPAIEVTLAPGRAPRLLGYSAEGPAAFVVTVLRWRRRAPFGRGRCWRGSHLMRSCGARRARKWSARDSDYSA
jgi:phosphopantetheine--protein transferase-like protein